MLLALEQRQVCTQARKATHGLDGQLIKTWTGLPVEESIRVTEDRDKWRKYVHGVADRRIEDGYGTQQNNVTDTVFTVRGAGSMKRASVRPAVCLSVPACGGFAAAIFKNFGLFVLLGPIGCTNISRVVTISNIPDVQQNVIHK